MGYALATPGSASWAFSKDAEGTWQPTTTVPLSDEDAEKLDALVEALEARDDVENVATNAE
jgi:transcriptional/translational regulatory protein YebC/TACO1